MAIPAVLDLAGVVTSVAIFGVSVVACFAWADDAVATADFDAGFTCFWAIPAVLDLAGVVTSVAILAVPVVSCFASADAAVTARALAARDFKAVLTFGTIPTVFDLAVFIAAIPVF